MDNYTKAEQAISAGNVTAAIAYALLALVDAFREDGAADSLTYADIVTPKLKGDVL